MSHAAGGSWPDLQQVAAHLYTVQGRHEEALQLLVQVPGVEGVLVGEHWRHASSMRADFAVGCARACKCALPACVGAAAAASTSPPCPALRPLSVACRCAAPLCSITLLGTRWWAAWRPTQQVGVGAALSCQA